MGASKVFFADLRASEKDNLFSKLLRLLDSGGIQDVVAPKNLVALKLHFGEKGNTSFIRPIFLRAIVDHIKKMDALPFLTDTNTLYAGTRGNSASHMVTAIENGFAYAVVGAPIIIADGMRGASFSRIVIDLEFIKTAYLGKEIVESDALISVGHFKGHELTGFAGTLKNLGIGCAARRGKLDQHSGLSPKIKRKRCIGCGECVEHCSQKAIQLNDQKATIDPKKCIGCGECILICQQTAVKIRWNADIPVFQKKMVEYAFAVMKSKKEKSFFINFLTDVTPACDCHGYSDTPIVNDIGIVASKDPVAIDHASAILVNQQVTGGGSCIDQSDGSVEDKFRQIYPKIDWKIQLEYAEKLKLGRLDYDLVKI
jgi:uncharacterized Fe-S center protein